MKRWTRKLLAGLLSVGMLLQVASPLSALAAEDTSGAVPELTITLTRTDSTGDYYIATGDSASCLLYTSPSPRD